jgi:hypothetical protein
LFPLFVKLCLVLTCVIRCLCTLLTYLYAGSPIPGFSSSSSRGGAPSADLASPASEAPEADKSQDEDNVEESEEETSSSISPPPALAEEVGVDKKRKRVDEIASSSSAAAGKAPVLAEDMEYYDMLAS